MMRAEGISRSSHIVKAHVLIGNENRFPLLKVGKVFYLLSNPPKVKPKANTQKAST